jgi:hypothetical protein
MWIASSPAFTFEGKDTLKISDDKAFDGLMAVLLYLQVFGLFRCVDC